MLVNYMGAFPCPTSIKHQGWATLARPGKPEHRADLKMEQVNKFLKS